MSGFLITNHEAKKEPWTHISFSEGIHQFRNFCHERSQHVQRTYTGHIRRVYNRRTQYLLWPSQLTFNTVKICQALHIFSQIFQNYFYIKPNGCNEGLRSCSQLAILIFWIIRRMIIIHKTLEGLPPVQQDTLLSINIANFRLAGSCIEHPHELKNAASY